MISFFILVIEGLASKEVATEKLKGLKRETTELKKQIADKEKLLEDEQKKEITEDHIEMLRFFLGRSHLGFRGDLKSSCEEDRGRGFGEHNY